METENETKIEFGTKFETKFSLMRYIVFYYLLTLTTNLPSLYLINFTYKKILKISTFDRTYKIKKKNHKKYGISQSIY